MLCQNCGKYEATTHVKRIINGEAAEAHLCSDCAKMLGYEDVFGGFGNIFGSFLGSFLGDTGVGSLSARTLKCEKCGSTFNNIVESGKIGCAECYKTFYEKLLPSLQRIHGKTRHEGKIPNKIAVKGDGLKEQIEKLEEELKTSVEAQNYETAALLRDRIKELKEGGKNE